MIIRLYSVGKTKERWLEEAIREYEKRLSSWTKLEQIFVKDNARLIQAVSAERRAIALDPAGDLVTSEQFSDFLQKRLEQSGSRLAFVIGGPEGIPPELDLEKISLSKLTFTHQIARLILAEQLYRAFTIADGLPYHK